MRVKLIAALAAISFPIALFYAALFREMRNLPMLDDYPVFLGFILHLKQAPRLGSKLLLFLTTQHFEYKLIVPEAIATLQCALTGHVNFEFLIVLGNLAVLGLLWLLWRNCFATEHNLTRRLILFLPICYLLLSLNYAEAVDLAEFGLQIGLTIFLAFASVHFLIRPDRRALLLACLCALLASLCNANGLLLAPIGLLILWPRRKPLHFSLWIVTLTLAAGIYAFHYVRPTMAADGMHTPLPQKTLFYLSFLGAAVENMSRFPIKCAAIALGLLCIAIFVHAGRTRFYRSNPFTFYTTLWCLLTAVMVTQGRSGLGIALSLSLRYKIYSDLLLIFCYIYAVSRLDVPAFTPQRRHQLYAAALSFAVLLCVASDYFGWKFLTNRQQRVQKGFDLYAADTVHHPPMVSLTDQPLPPQEPEACRITLNQAIAAGIYTLPPPSKR